MPVEFSGADAGVVVSMTKKKKISNCDQRYCTINGSGELFPIICGQIKGVTGMLKLINVKTSSLATLSLVDSGTCPLRFGEDKSGS